MLYKEETVAVYTRASDIMINNPLPSSGLSPQIRFNEERAVKDPDGTLRQIGGMIGQCGLEMTAENATTPFPLMHPELNVQIGEATYQDLQVLLYSLYIHATELRDNAPADEPIPLPEGVESALDMGDA